MKVSEDLNGQFKNHLGKQESKQALADSVSIKILNVAAWARSNERVPVTLPRELEDYIPEVEEFYKVAGKCFQLDFVNRQIGRQLFSLTSLLSFK